jgi:hypothetical protein
MALPLNKCTLALANPPCFSYEGNCKTSINGLAFCFVSDEAASSCRHAQKGPVLHKGSFACSILRAFLSPLTALAAHHFKNIYL